jgi:beta-glucosidase
VQVYIKKPKNENFIKVKELIAFSKTKELKPGESQTLNMKIDLNDLASYDDIGVTGNRACYIIEKGIYEIYIGDSVASIRNKNNLVYSYNHKELTIAKKLTNRLVPQDKDVFDSNKKPNFSNFTNYLNENFRKLREKIDDNQIFNLDNNNDNNLYSEIPTNAFNEINFKSVLQKKYKMEQLVDSMTNEELIFLSYGKKSNIKGGKGLIGGFYNSGITRKYNIPF